MGGGEGWMEESLGKGSLRAKGRQRPRDGKLKKNKGIHAERVWGGRERGSLAVGNFFIPFNDPFQIFQAHTWFRFRFRLSFFSLQNQDLLI
jgi:hypothetical protein